MKVSRSGLAVVAGVVALALGMLWLAGREPEVRRAVRVPELSETARVGMQAFDRYCAECHGAHGAGSDKGPSLIDRTYHPRLHADAAFELAVRRGVPGHHWRFGDMPPQTDVTPSEIGEITRYIRELQKANGIY